MSAVCANIWHCIEACHFWLLAQRQLLNGHFEYARRTSEILQIYEDLLQPVDMLALVAVVYYYNRYHGRCSRAFMKLKTSPNISKELLLSVSNIATAVFHKVCRTHLIADLCSRVSFKVSEFT